MWVVGGVLYWFESISGGDSLDQLYWGNMMEIGGSGTLILAGVLAIVMVWQITLAQGQKHARIMLESGEAA